MIILAGEILHLSQPFLEKDIHPTVIVRAYMKALDAAVKIIDEFLPWTPTTGSSS